MGKSSRIQYVEIYLRHEIRISSDTHCGKCDWRNLKCMDSFGDDLEVEYINECDSVNFCDLTYDKLKIDGDKVLRSDACMNGQQFAKEYREKKQDDWLRK